MNMHARFNQLRYPESRGSLLPLAIHVKLLGVTLDNHFSRDKHVSEVSHACLHYLRVLRLIQPTVTAEDANLSVCSVSAAPIQSVLRQYNDQGSATSIQWSRLNYVQTVQHGVSLKSINRLQLILYALVHHLSNSKLCRVQTCYYSSCWLPSH